jgi:phenylalanyl-tRNA synthetase beta chain
MNIKEDIYEEVARIYGYDQIENIPLLSKTEHIPYNEYVAIQRKIEDILVRNMGCNQVETYPRVSEKEIKELGGDTNVLYKLQNPVNPEKPYLRAGMHYELFAHTAKNSKFFDEFKIFDIGKVWNTKETKEQRNKELKITIPETLKA